MSLLNVWFLVSVALAAALAVTTYLLLVGPHPALLPASIMALLALLSLSLERPPAAVNALGPHDLAAVVSTSGGVPRNGTCTRLMPFFRLTISA